MPAASSAAAAIRFPGGLARRRRLGRQRPVHMAGGRGAAEWRLYRQRFERGSAVYDLKDAGPLENPEETGTTVRFPGCPEIFKETTVYEVPDAGDAAS